VITNGVDAPPHDCSGEAANGLRASLGIPTDTKVVGSVGRLVPVKSFETLLQSTALLSESGVPVELILVGEGECRSRLTQIAGDLGIIDHVHLVGEQENVGDWLMTMQLYVNCSLSEGMSQAVLEAMSMGLPIVATDVGANRRLVSGVNGCGLVVQPGTPQQLADAIRQIVSSSELTHGYAANARRRHTQEYGIERMLSDYEKLYRNVTSSL
jgi:glycosyltransferase involved in cell wall biosynthesis